MLDKTAATTTTIVTTTIVTTTIIAVIFIAPRLTDKGEHTALYKTNKNLHIETSKIIIMLS